MKLNYMKYMKYMKCKKYSILKLKKTKKYTGNLEFRIFPQLFELKIIIMQVL